MDMKTDHEIIDRWSNASDLSRNKKDILVDFYRMMQGYHDLSIKYRVFIILFAVSFLTNIILLWI